MNKTNITLLVSFLFSAFASIASVPYNAWWQKANSYYQDKNYDSAAFYYEQLSEQHPDNAEVYYNLGNTYYRLNKIGAAVLNFERALKLKPSYKEAQDNLELTQSRIPNRIRQSQDIFFVSWWKSITKTSLAETWSVIALVMFLLVLTLFILKRWNYRFSAMPTQIAVTALILCCLAFLLAYVASSRKLAHNKAVVMEQDAPLQENLKTQKIQVLVPEGTVLVIDNVQSGWANVRLPNGRAGWMRIETLERI